MRGTFALVICAGVAAAAAVTVWNDGGSPGEPAEAETAEPVDRPLVVAKDTPLDLDVQRGSAATDLPPLARRVDELLDRGSPSGAASELLRAESSVVHDPAVRGRMLRTAAELARWADGQTGAPAVQARLSARRLYAAVYDCDAASDEQLEAAFAGCKRIHDLLLFRGRGAEELVLLHPLKPGDRLWNLSRGAWRTQGVSVAPGFVLHVNGISDPRRVPASGTLRVPKEPLELLVRKSRFDLTVRLGGAPVERFEVGLGAEGSTPVGTFRIKNRIKNPDWWYGGERIPFGDPRNLIGTRWMGFEGDTRAEGIGIHGTNDASSVGKAVSMGCIRMRDNDVERLFEWVDTGTGVEIR